MHLLPTNDRSRLGVTLAAGSFAVAVSFFANVASAQRCPTRSGVSPEVANLDARERLAFIRRRIDHAAYRSRVWASAWGSAYATVATVQGVRIALTDDRTTQIESGLAAGSAALGAAFVAVSPPAVLWDTRSLRRRIARTRQSDDVCAVVAEAEAMLERDAGNQAFGIGPLMQTVTVGYNVALGLVIGFWLHDWTNAAITIGSGIAISELMTFTQPTDAIDAWRRYRIGDLRSTIRPSTSYWIVAPDIAPERVGLSVRGTL